MAARLAARGPAPLIRVTRGGDEEVSSAQRRLWFIDQLVPGNPVFNLSAVVRLEGPLDVQRLERAVLTVADRHEALRTILPSIAGRPVQRVLPRPALRLTPVDLTGASAAKVDFALSAETRRSFDLERGPLARWVLMRLAGAPDNPVHLLVLTIHHSVCDGWSTGILIDEVLRLYGADADVTRAGLPPVDLDYVDYAAWESERERAGAHAAALEYWSRALRGAPSLLELPLDRPRPPVSTYHGSRHHVVFADGMWAAVQELARAERATPFTVLLAGFAAVMCRYASQDEAVIAVPTANRPRRELEVMVGCFANSVALRVDTSGHPTFAELIARTRLVTRDAMAHSEVSFDRVVATAAPDRDLGRAPLAQVSLALVEDLAGREEVGGVVATPVRHHSGTSPYDLSAEFWPDARGRLHMELEYATDLFDGTTVARMADHLRHGLQIFVATPDASVVRAHLLSDDELRRLPYGPREPAAAEPAPSAWAHELFHRQHERAPDATALVVGDRSVTYGELAARTNALAVALERAGVGLESRVGLLLDRGVDLVAAVLAVLTVGATYVPLDRREPPGRLAAMLDDADATLVLTDRGGEAPGAAELGVPSLKIGDLPHVDDLVALSAGARWRPRADNAAYIIFTSGSTGRPKGVTVTHGGLANYLAWAVRTYDVAERGDAPLVSSLRFDLSVTTLLCPLVTGRSITLVPEGDELDVLARVLRDPAQLGLVKLTPSHLEALHRSMPLGRTLAALHLVVGGESLQGRSVAAWRDRLPGVHITNEYGPTETVVGCCTYTVDDGTDLSGTVPIGRPIDRTELHVLDRALMPVVPGAVGELYVSGAGIARGYVNRPDSTAERFVANPYASTPGSRMYRTGDLVRLRRDGELECLGRTDTQVKIRGFRVELQEIESVLTSLVDVAEAVVLMRDDLPGDPALVAYVSPPGTGPACGTADLVDRLRGELSATLPEYMIPQTWVVLDELPLVANGKVDRRALPIPDDACPEPGGWNGEDGNAPATPLEELVAGVWADVLDLSTVGRDQSFLDLGGHSLLATRAVARIRDALGVDLPLRALFEARSVSDLAARIAGLRHNRTRPPLVPGPRDTTAPVSYAQGRLFFLSRLAEHSAFYNVPVALRLDGPLDRSALARAFATMWSRHDGLRTVFPANDGGPVQQVLPPEPVPYEEHDLTDADGGLDALLEREARQRFDLAAGPLVRARLVRVAPATHVLALTLHHIVSDGWSMGIVLDELTTLYRSYAEAAPSPLAPVAVTCADVARWQRMWLEGDELEAQLAYWRRALRGAATLNLPVDRPRPRFQTYRGARLDVRWDADLGEQVRIFARKQGATPFMVLLAAFDALLARRSGQCDITVGTPIANRSILEIEGVVGYLSNTLALRVDLSGAPTFTSLLRRVREVALAAYDHQDAPFDMVVDAVDVVRDASQSPLFQVWFALQNQVARAPDLGADLTLTPMYAAQKTARFDLLLDLWESGSGGLEGYVEYSSDLFEADSIANMISDLETLLRGLLQRPNVPVTEVSTSTPEDRERVLALGRPSTLAVPPVSVVRRIAQQASDLPDAPAVTFGDETLTYAELWRRSASLASRLGELGVGPEMLVGVHLERGCDAVVAVLAALRTGAAYLPLDPDYPAERLATVVANALPAVVITSRDLVRASFGAAIVLVVDEDAQTSDVQATPVDVRPEHPAYVVYTSGSSGRPKGVVVTHAGLALYVKAMPDRVGAGVPWRVLHTASFAFSSSVRQLLVPLAHGGHVVIAPRALLNSPRDLLALAASHGVELIDVVPSYLRVLLPALADPGLRPRAILTASEPLPYDLPEAIRRMPGAMPLLVNMYGQTETTGIVAAATVPDQRAGRGLVVPLGRPIAGVELHVLAADLTPAGPGEVGEVVVAGPTLARGYLGDPGLTAERFISHPWGPPGSRLYRTGDLARRLPDGSLEFLGRIGDQVKVRGHRVEPQEVGAALAAVEGVVDSAVVVAATVTGEQQLVGYLVANRPGPDVLEFVRVALRHRLPDYMVPRLVLVERLPRLPNGKVDRQALELAEVPEVLQPRRAPRNRREEFLTGIWRELLARPEVGVHEDFFHLGGDSLLVIRVVERARRAGLIITPAQMIANPTVAGLAEVAVEVGDPDVPPVPCFVPADPAAPMPMVPSHRAFLERSFPVPERYIHSFAFEARERLDPALLRRAVSAVLAAQDALRVTFPVGEDGIRTLAVRREFARKPFTVLDLERLDAAEQDAELVRCEGLLHEGFHYGNGPLIHVALARLGRDRPDRLLVLVHHQLMDNSSWANLVAELESAYRVLARGRTPAPVAPPGAFATWARALSALADSPDLRQDADYWLAESARVLPVLPPARPGPNLMSAQETLSAGLYEGEVVGMRARLARLPRVTTNDVLMSALLASFASWSGRRALLVDVVGRGRDLGVVDGDLSAAIGRFSLTSPRLLELPDDLGPLAPDNLGTGLAGDHLLRSVARQLRAVPRLGLGFGLLRYLSRDSETAAALEPLAHPEVLVSDWGAYQEPDEGTSLFGPALETTIEPVAVMQRMHRFSVSSRIDGTRLEVALRYNRDLDDPVEVGRLCDSIQSALRHLAQGPTDASPPCDDDHKKDRTT